ncbi:hypothetical protein AJ78_03937 [Emergomyces pasteurianus Ep9510]|uniref:Uncharacterized protein n=1 Tax=Emergomyces pasteurianus Ep9510 TaxID=1447872 RepID=A0A1J9PHD2_9EURO|nr:hypothetical protein AJ78_03937 [Emergomyces pasteurianus Ep9510]
MAPRQRRSKAKKPGHQAKSSIKVEALKAQDRGRRLQRVKRGQPRSPVRRSGRLEEIRRNPECNDINTKQKHPYPFSKSDLPGASLLLNPIAPLPDKDRKRKRSWGPEDPIPHPAEDHQKRLRTTTSTAAVESSSVETTADHGLPNHVCESDINPIDYWVQRGQWPKKYFGQEGSMDSLFARKRSTSSFRRKQSESGSVTSFITPSDQKPRDEKSAPYTVPRYQTVLESRGSFMKKSRGGITDGSSTLIKSMLNTVSSLLRIHYFEMTYST